MQIKQMVRYRIRHDSGWMTAAAFFAGLSIFAIALYYFALCDISAISVGTWILHVILPLLWYVAFAVLLKVVRLDMPIVYCGMAAIYCLLMMIWGFQYPTILGGILGLIFFLLCAGALVVTALGILPGKYYLATAFGAVVLMQIFWRDLSQFILPLKLKEYLPYLARISGVASLSLLCFGMKGRPVKK